MRVIEAVNVSMDLDPWMGLEALSEYSGLSVRSLRGYLADPIRPLPCYRMKEPHVIRETLADGSTRRRSITGKILVRRSDFDAWMSAFKHEPDATIHAAVDEIFRDLQSTP